MLKRLGIKARTMGVPRMKLRAEKKEEKERSSERKRGGSIGDKKKDGKIEI